VPFQTARARVLVSSAAGNVGIRTHEGVELPLAFQECRFEPLVRAFRRVAEPMRSTMSNSWPFRYPSKGSRMDYRATLYETKSITLSIEYVMAFEPMDAIQ
jgi:hypothetical protein